MRIFFQDEARVGQQGTLTRVWAPRGSRPRAIKQTEYKWVYLWAAVEPASGELAAMVTPDVNTDRMSQFLQGLSSMLGTDDLAIVVLDNAGWHRAKALKIPQNLVLLPLPSYSPELNPSETLWQWLRVTDWPIESTRIMTTCSTPPQPRCPTSTPIASAVSAPART